MSDPTIPDWINAGAGAAGALAVIAGLFGANSAIKENRETAKALRRSKVAEELIALSFNVEDALKHMRNSMDSTPVDKDGDKVYRYKQRYERVVEHNSLFRSLRDAQIRVRAVIGDKEVDEAVEELFRARTAVAVAIEMLIFYARQNDDDSKKQDQEHKNELKKDLYGSYSKHDDLGTKILASIKIIEDKLSPIARLEAS